MNNDVDRLLASVDQALPEIPYADLDAIAAEVAPVIEKAFIAPFEDLARIEGEVAEVAAKPVRSAIGKLKRIEKEVDGVANRLFVNALSSLSETEIAVLPVIQKLNGDTPFLDLPFPPEQGRPGGPPNGFPGPSLPGQPNIPDCGDPRNRDLPYCRVPGQPPNGGGPSIPSPVLPVPGQPPNGPTTERPELGKPGEPCEPMPCDPCGDRVCTGDIYEDLRKAPITKAVPYIPDCDGPAYMHTQFAHAQLHNALAPLLNLEGLLDFSSLDRWHRAIWDRKQELIPAYPDESTE